MRSHSFSAAVLPAILLIGFGSGAEAQAPSTASAGAAPVAPIRPVTDDYHWIKVSDPYRYMENLKDPEVQIWIKGQDDFTRAVLARIPARRQLLERIRELDQSVPRVVARRMPDDVYLLLKRLPKEDIAKLYVRQVLEGEDKLIVNPENVKLAQANQGKGRSTIHYFEPSRDGKYVAVGIAPGGAERDTEIHIFEIASGRETGDVIPRGWGSGPQWLPDNRSLVYTKLRKLPPDVPAIEIEQKVLTYLHVLGTDSEKDPAVFGYGVVPGIEVDPTYFGSVIAPPGWRYALGVINSGVSPNSAFYIEGVGDVGKTKAAWRKVADFSDDVEDVAVHDDDLYVLTYKGALRCKVVRTDAGKPDLASAETVVAAGEAVVTGMHTALDALYVELLDGGIARVLRVPYGPRPQHQEVALPFQGSALVSTDPRITGAVLELTSWTKAPRIYAYDLQTKSVRNTGLQPAGPFDDPPDVESIEVKVPSHDGVLVPLSITYPERIKLDGSNPTRLVGYGAYGIPIQPEFRSTRIAWYERGGIYAVCHVRGGGEYGEEWHLAGKEATKPNTWRDFIACGEYLVRQKYTSPARLSGEAGSAGGILIGRAITERPDLFGAAIDAVGLSDLLRSETTANGLPNVPEFGSTKTESGFKALFAMSTYEHIEEKTPYPAVLVETGMNDPRVDPWEAAKLTARLQAATSSARPVLLRVEYEGGHGGIGGTAKQAQERLADEWSFLLWRFGIPEFQQPGK
jgi:prolyl oligopeptidase